MAKNSVEHTARGHGKIPIQDGGNVVECVCVRVCVAGGRGTADWNWLILGGGFAAAYDMIWYFLC